MWWYLHLVLIPFSRHVVTVQAGFLGWQNLVWSDTTVIAESIRGNHSCCFAALPTLQIVLCVCNFISFCSWYLQQGSDYSSEGKMVNRKVRSAEARTRPNTLPHSTGFDPWAVLDPSLMVNWTQRYILLKALKYVMLTEISGSKVNIFMICVIIKPMNGVCVQSEKCFGWHSGLLGIQKIIVTLKMYKRSCGYLAFKTSLSAYLSVV